VYEYTQDLFPLLANMDIYVHAYFAVISLDENHLIRQLYRSLCAMFVALSRVLSFISCFSVLK